MNSNIKLILGIVLGLAIAPALAYAVDSQIIIDMVLNQNTNPFEIKDDVGTNVFAVDSDGRLITESVSATSKNFNFNQVSTFTSVNKIESNPEFLFQYELNRNGACLDCWYEWTEGIMTGESGRTAGIGQCYLQYMTKEGGTWFNGNGYTWTTSTDILTTADMGQLADTSTAFGLALYSSDGATTCTVSNLGTSVTLVLNPAWTITRVI